MKDLPSMSLSSAAAESYNQTRPQSRSLIDQEFLFLNPENVEIISYSLKVNAVGIQLSCSVWKRRNQLSGHLWKEPANSSVKIFEDF